MDFKVGDFAECSLHETYKYTYVQKAAYRTGINMFLILKTNIQIKNDPPLLEVLHPIEGIMKVSPQVLRKIDV